MSLRTNAHNLSDVLAALDPFQNATNASARSIGRWLRLREVMMKFAGQSL